MAEFNVPEDMGFLAEDACRELAAVIRSADRRGDYRGLIQALRRFMAEAKKGGLQRGDAGTT